MGALNKLAGKLIPLDRQIVFGTFHALYGRHDGSPYAWYCPAHPEAAVTEGPRTLAEAKAGAEKHGRDHTRFVIIHLED